MDQRTPATTRSERLREQLGMAHGTAWGRLRLLILFSILHKHGENVCYVCGETIGSADELSIEHKQPWEGRDAAFFWDLDNIAFSHRTCNRQHLNHGGRPLRADPPEGMAWCWSCQRFQPIEDFCKSSRHWNGLAYQCRESLRLRRRRNRWAREFPGC